MPLNIASRARYRLATAIVVFSSAFPVMALAAEPASAPLHALFSAPVTVRATGQIEIGELSGVKGVLAEAVRAKLSDVHMAPATSSAVAVDARMVVQGRAVLNPTDAENYALALEELGLLPLNAMADVLMPPRYPADMFTRDQEGSVELELTVDESGRIAEMRTVSSTHAAFEKAVRTAAKGWKFKASGGNARFSVPIVFRLAGKRQRPQQTHFECALPAGQAHIAGQSGCVPLIEVTGSRARKS